MSESSGWISFSPGDTDEYLTQDQREIAERLHRETEERRGRQIVRVVVDVFENDQAVPFVQFPAGSPIGPDDREATGRLVRLAAEELQNWR